MAVISRLKYHCPNPKALVQFYCEILGMREKSENVVGYGPFEACLEFTASSDNDQAGQNDYYWKIALAVPNIELACQQLARRGVNVSTPFQFQDVGYLAHFQDPAGFAIELIDHAFQGARSKVSFDESLFGGGAHLNLLTLRTNDIAAAETTCLAWGMKPLCVQPVKGREFTLYFYADTDETPPSPDLAAIQNRTWLYQRPYTVLELQYLHEKPELAIKPEGAPGFAGFVLSGAANEKIVCADLTTR